MPADTYLAATHLTSQDIRIYYQDDQNLIKESSYDSINGWFTGRDDVVAVNAKKHTALAVASWIGKNKATEVKIRVYYLSELNKLLERKRSTNGTDEGSWEDSLHIETISLASDTRLAVTCTGSSDVYIRVFYQATDNTLCQTMYRSSHGRWKDFSIESRKFKAPNGSSLTAVAAAGRASDIRLFYQGNNGLIEEIQYERGNWQHRTFEHFAIVDHASISAACWKDFSNLRIRIYSVDANQNLVMMTYNEEHHDWDKVLKVSEEIVMSGSAIAVIHTPGGKTYGFYQPDGRKIAPFSFDEDGDENKRVPLGIPLSIGANPVAGTGATTGSGSTLGDGSTPGKTLGTVGLDGVTSGAAPSIPPGERERYKYEPLSVRTPKVRHNGKSWDFLMKDEPQIRLLHLSSGEGSEQLTCSLQIVKPFKDLDCLMSSPRSPHPAKPFYEAISYVWGDATMKEVIVCDGKTLWITSSLANALRRVRLSTKDRVLWADGICINQDDIKERGHQVILMAAIYSAARRVLCWLGDDAKFQAKKTFKLAKKLSRRIQPRTEAKILRMERGTYVLDSTMDFALRFTHDKLEKKLKKKLNDIQEFFQNPWFSRMWIRQEIGFASKALALCGTEKVDWVALQNLSEWALIRGIRTGCPTMHKPCPHIGEFYTKRTSFLDLLIDSRRHDCSNPVDRIFALLAHPSASIEISLPERLKDYTAGLRSGSRNDGEGLEPINIEKAEAEWYNDLVSITYDLWVKVTGSNGKENDRFPQDPRSFLEMIMSGPPLLQSSAPIRGIDRDEEFKSTYFQLQCSGKKSSSRGHSNSGRFRKSKSKDILDDIPEHSSKPEDGMRLDGTPLCGCHNGDILTVDERHLTTLFWDHESHLLLIPGRDAPKFCPFPSSRSRSSNCDKVRKDRDSAPDKKSATAMSLRNALAHTLASRMPEASAFDSIILDYMASHTCSLNLKPRMKIRQESGGVALGDYYLPVMDPALRTVSKENTRLCDVCRMIDFKSFKDEKHPRTWLVIPPPWPGKRYENCRFCRFLCGVAWQREVPLQQDGSYVPVAIATTLLHGYIRPQSETKKKQPTSYFIIPVSKCDVPCIEARLVASEYNSASPLMARLPPRDVIDASLVKYWLKYCETRHKNICGALPWDSEGEVLPPFRVIDVKTYTLVDASKDCRYCALSYVWGPAHTNVREMFRTTSKNKKKASRLGGLQGLSEEMSKTVLDAIRLVIAIGEKFLWVDAICIIQDDKHDIDSQIEHMNEIYSRAVLTIIAAGGVDSNAGLSGVHPHLRVLPQVTEEVDDGVRLALPLEPSRKLKASAWSSRAWTLQEEILSARTLIFIDDQVFWRCRCSTWFEDVISEVDETPEGSPAFRTDVRSNNLIIEVDDTREIKNIQHPRGREDPPFSLEEYGSTGARYEPAISLEDAMDPGEEFRRDNYARYTTHHTFDIDIDNIVKPKASVAPVRYTIGKHYLIDGEEEVEEFFSLDPRHKDAIIWNGPNHASFFSWNFREYTNVVLQYMKRQLTYPSDIGKAFAGIQKAFTNCLKLPFVHGLPTSYFDAALLWMPEHNLTRRVVEDVNSPPSWSWMGWCGPVRYNVVDTKVDQPEVRVHPLVRWYYGDRGSGGFELLNGSGVGMATACHPAGCLIKGWKDDRWTKDCLYNYGPSSDSDGDEMRVTGSLPAVGDCLRFQSWSASFKIGDWDWDWDDDSPCLIIEKSIKKRESDHDHMFTRSMRPNRKCHRIIDQVERSAGYMIWNESDPKNCGTSEIIILAATAGRGKISGGYSGYAVMAIKWENGIAYRTGLGEIDQEMWWDASPCWKEIILG